MREAETEIRKKYPEAAFIELEPDSSAHNMFALEQFQTPALRKVGIDSMRRVSNGGRCLLLECVARPVSGEVDCLVLSEVLTMPVVFSSPSDFDPRSSNASTEPTGRISSVSPGGRKDYEANTGESGDR